MNLPGFNSTRLRASGPDGPVGPGAFRAAIFCVLGLWLPLVTGGSLAAGPARVLYVAPGGSDQWSGSRAAPNLFHTDGPLATVERALEIGRTGSLAGDGVAERRIVLRGGHYFLSAPLTIRPADSRTTVEAFEGEEPILSGGVRVTGWKPAEVGGKRVWAAEIPAVLRGQPFHALWVNGRRAARARYPSQGYLEIAAPLDPSTDWTHGHLSFQFKPGDLQNWPSASEAEVIVMSRWVESRLPVFTIDVADRSVHFTKRSVFQLQAGDPYYLEGIFAFLDTPGEWCLDAAAGKVYYLPRPGEQLRKLEAIAPALSRLLQFEADPAGGTCVSNVLLRGLTLAHAEWRLPEPEPGLAEAGPFQASANVGGFAQAAIGVPAAVTAAGLRSSRLENCRFVHLGSYALELGAGCVGNTVTGCDFRDLGAGGIKIGEGRVGGPAETARENEISDCRLVDGGKTFHSAVGIWIGQSPGNRILHNEVADFYYTGLSAGWTWGYGAALASNNLIAWNEVHHIGIKSDGDGPILSDMGGIYTLGRQPGTIIASNRWHDIAGRRYGGWGIYFDEGSSGIEAFNNVVWRTTHGGFHQHYGATNRVYNNVFALARVHQLQRTRSEPHISFYFQTNIVYFDTGALLGGDWSGGQFVMENNVYYDRRAAGARDFPLGPCSWEEWRARGHDTNSLLADPRFVDAEHYRFQLQSNSPALPLGFQSFNLEAAGPRSAKRDL